MMVGGRCWVVARIGGEMSARENMAADWGSVDWGLPDAEIARRVGRSRERVRQVRRDFGKGRSAMWHGRLGTARDKISKGRWDLRTPAEVAKAVGCDEGWAEHCLQSSGKSHVRPPDGRALRRKYRWDTMTAADWARLTDRQVARRLGVGNFGVVTQWRRRHGIFKEERAAVAAEVRG